MSAAVASDHATAAVAVFSGSTASTRAAASATDATTPSRRGDGEGHGTQADQHRDRHPEGQGGRGGETQKTPDFTFNGLPTGGTELASPEEPQELSSPMRRRRSLEHLVARSTSTPERTLAPERIASDNWGGPSPAATPEESMNPRNGDHSHDGGGLRGGGGADADCGVEVGEGGKRHNVQNLAAMFGGAGKSASTLSAGTKSSPPQRSAGARAVSDMPLPSSSPPDPPDPATEPRGSNRLDPLRARPNGAGVGRQDKSGGRREEDRATTDDGGGGYQRRGGDDRPDTDDEAAERSLSPARGSAWNRGGLTLAENPTPRALLSKIGSTRLMVAAGDCGQQSSDAAGKNTVDGTSALQQQRIGGGHKSGAEGRPTFIAPRAAQMPATGDSSGSVSNWYRIGIRGGGGSDDDHGECGVRDDGGGRYVRGQRRQASKTATSNITAVTTTGGPGTFADVEEMPPDALSDSQPHDRSDNWPAPSPASACGYSSPPSIERPRRSFFGPPRQASTGGVDGDGGDNNRGDSGGGGGNEPNLAARLNTEDHQKGGARAILTDREDGIAEPVTQAGDSSGGNSSRPSTSFAAAAAAAAAGAGSSGNGRSKTSRPWRRSRSFDPSPPSTPTDLAANVATGFGPDTAEGASGGGGGGGSGSGGGGAGGGGNRNMLSKMLGATMNRRATSSSIGAYKPGSAAAAAGNRIENARPST